MCLEGWFLDTLVESAKSYDETGKHKGQHNIQSPSFSKSHITESTVLYNKPNSWVELIKNKSLAPKF